MQRKTCSDMKLLILQDCNPSVCVTVYVTFLKTNKDKSSLISSGLIKLVLKKKILKNV